MRFIIISFIFLSNLCFGQQKTIQELKEVTITIALDTLTIANTWEDLNSSAIQDIQADDAGELIQKLTSTNIKSYGGLGGLKTVSSRGLGASHSAIVSDGFVIQNTQNGQVNLGQIHSDNIVLIRSNSNGQSQLTLPVSAQVSGSQFSLETFENNFSEKGLQYRVLGKQGSFDQIGTYGSIKYTDEKILISAHGNFRKTDGAYPYRFENGTQTVEGRRTNNDYKDHSFGFTTGFRGKRSISRLGYLQKEFKQGIPGAVILYNSSSDERMESSDKTIFGDHIFKGETTVLRSFFKLNKNLLNYSDPDYLNQDGGINDDYENRSIQIGFNCIKKTGKQLQFHFGIEHVLSNLEVSDKNFSRPIRQHHFAILGIDYELLNKIQLTAQLSQQFISENNLNGQNATDRYKLNPHVKFSTKARNYKFKQELWYRNSFRMPSFNELYYSNIGNTNLLPEEAHQFNYGWSMAPIESKKFKLYLRNNIYTNYVSNKIVAIPTKNLFIWSMQNVENARIFGADFKMGSHWLVEGNIKFILDLNYSFQRAIDITEPSAPSYKDQIAYIPLHTGNIDLAMHYKNMGLRVSNYVNSYRYSLNENIEANKVDGFWTSTISAFYALELKKKNVVTLRLTVKNLLNQSYAYIRSYIMPGRNYLIVLKYAFN